MRKTIFNILIITVMALLVSCDKETVKENKPLIKDTLKINFRKNYTTLFPPKVLDATSSQIVAQIYTGLVRYNPKNLKIEPSIAKSWHKVNDTTFIFNIRNDVYFGKYEILGNKPVKLTMDDILFTFQFLCTNTKQNKNFYSTLWQVKGAKKYYSSHNKLEKKFEIEGIKAINDSTLQIIIEDKDFPLLKVLANPTAYIFSKKAYKKLKDATYVGAGPYQIYNPKDIRLNAGINDDIPDLLLSYNPYYFERDREGNTLPYMSHIKISFVKYEKKELKMLGEGNLDIIFNVSNDNVIYFLDKYISKVNSKNPYFVVRNSCKDIDGFVNIYKSNIKDFYTNALFYLDLSRLKVTRNNNKVEK